MESNQKNTQMLTKKAKIGAALGNYPDYKNYGLNEDGEGNQKVYTRFSPQFRNMLRTANVDSNNDPSIASGVENFYPSEQNDNRGWWLRIQKSIIYHISDILNKDKNFGRTCAWILNHGAFCQIGLDYDLSQDKILTVTNMIATWPSTAINKVELLPQVMGDSYRFKLVINKEVTEGDIRKNLQNIDLSKEFDFGFDLNTQRDEFLDKLSPQANDNFKVNDGGNEQRMPEAVKLLRSLFKQFREIGATVESNPLPQAPVNDQVTFFNSTGTFTFIFSKDHNNVKTHYNNMNLKLTI
jgi:hypothetical protein